jgi:hypothetical protein
MDDGSEGRGRRTPAAKPRRGRGTDFDKFEDATSGRLDGWISHFFGHTPADARAGAKPTEALTAEFLEHWVRNGATVSGSGRRE